MRPDFSYYSQLIKPSRGIVIFLTLFSIAISFIVAKAGFTIGVALVAIMVALPIVILLLTDINFGFFALLVSSYFIAFISKITEGLIPVLVLEIMMLIVFTGFIIKQIRTHSGGINPKYLRHPITIAILVWTVYTHLQFFNPNSSSIMGKLVAIRFSWYNLLGFVLALAVFKDLKQVKTFLKIVLVLSVLAGLFGLSQRYIGLLPFEERWLYSLPDQGYSWSIGGRLRVWSFLNDPANFGILTAFSSQLCFMLALGPYSQKRRILLFICGILLVFAMVASETRTAFVQLTVGFAIFGLLTVNNIKTILFSLLVMLIFLGIYFGPFYSGPVLRIRSAFKGNEDPSMNVRSENKTRIQPYIWSHPIGGGPSTTGEPGKLLAPGHPLAGFPPDSGYLQIGLEFGYIGLLMVLWQYFIACSKAVHQYFRVRDKEIRIFYVALLSCYIALFSANLTQISSTMRPFDFFTFCFLAIIIKLNEFDNKGPS